jgi:hypothetical protein
MENIHALRELLWRAVRTLQVVPDSDLKFRLGERTAWPAFVRHARDAYGSAPPRFRTFQPTRADLTVYLEVLSWLDWYQRTYGDETVRLFRAWCHGAAMWELQERTSTNRRRPCSPQTVKNRRNAMILAIAAQYPDATRTCVDNHPEVAKFAAASIEDADLSSDLRDLPKPPKTWRPASPVTLSPAEQAAAHAALEKQLRRNGSRAAKRASKPLG